MDKYDLTVLIKSDLKGETRDEFMKKIEKIVKALDGVVGKVSEMGTKQLAYKIKNLTEAAYISWIVELPKASVVQLGKKLTVDREILRHLLVKVEK